MHLRYQRDDARADRTRRTIKEEVLEEARVNQAKLPKGPVRSRRASLDLPAADTPVRVKSPASVGDTSDPWNPMREKNTNRSQFLADKSDRLPPSDKFTKSPLMPQRSPTTTANVSRPRRNTLPNSLPSVK
jgi:hypothetical protein